VTADQWRDELYRLNVLDKAAKNPASRFSELREALQVKRVIGVNDELVLARYNSRLQQPKHRPA
jgi:hypothetical protein